MEKVVIKATKRSVTGKQVRALRRAGELPGILYGFNMEPVNISMDAHDATLVLNRTTASSLINIELDGKEYPTLVREKQRNPIKNVFVHIDFQSVSLTEKIRAKVAVQLTGLSPAVKDFNAVLVTGFNELEVEGFPQDLPQRIVVDISGMLKIGDGIYVRDIVVSDKVKVLDDVNEMLVLATAPKAEVVEEVVPEVEAVEEGAEPEVIEKGKKEEELAEEEKK
ncbi:MAG: 50S ribosomal protein L25 [Chloroflexi bacterium]|nr:50S ribosomal protein L25 [Chloroflexota bacterium]